MMQELARWLMLSGLSLLILGWFILCGTLVGPVLKAFVWR